MPEIWEFTAQTFGCSSIKLGYGNPDEGSRTGRKRLGMYRVEQRRKHDDKNAIDQNKE